MRAAEKIYSSAAGIAVAVASSATAIAAVPPRPYVDPNPYFVDAHPVWATVIAIYIVIAALIVFPTVRRPLLRWYGSQRFYYRGKDATEVMLKQIGMRLSVESTAFMVACLVGALGGWIYVLMRAQAGTPAAVRTAD
ncbi:hypothetical protein D3273_19500 [Lichenibacterium minor]|uniref:ABC transporter permease n=1 Tax=Lichenibacterium minor TaxID=2316528 RepID=A0A4Q2U1K1_9HYPH|nr:hypothetical protein [Lichenibacterium minor]RYC30349.1 hypothetical protein D3273_19500 [Lichenibacterium minor]